MTTPTKPRPLHHVRTARLAAIALAAPALGLTLLAGPASAAAPAQAAPPHGRYCSGEPATILGTAADDVLVGTPGPDVIVGRGGDDTITGMGGDDLICAGGGNDHVTGDGGDDIIDGGTGDDLLTGGEGDDQLVDGAIPTGKPDADSLYGGSGNDSLSANAGDDRLYGGPGKDAVSDNGVVSSDFLRGGPGNDVVEDITSPNGQESVEGGSGRDNVVIENDSPRPVELDLASGALTVETAGDTVYSSVVEFENAQVIARGRVSLRGTDGPNRLDVSASTLPATLEGLGGNDVLFGGDAVDLLDGGAGRDTAHASSDPKRPDRCLAVEKVIGSCAPVR